MNLYPYFFHCELLYLILGSATIDDLSSSCFEILGGVVLTCCCIGVSAGLISTPFCSSLLTPMRSSGTSWVGASSAVILRSRAASSDLSCFNSSSLPHVLAMMASSLAVQGRRISLIWNNTYLILSIISLLFMKNFSRMLLITSRT